MTSNSQLPEYSAELLAENFPNRKDHTILSGPYTPACLARDVLATAQAERDYWKDAQGKMCRVEMELRACIKELLKTSGEPSQAVKSLLWNYDLWPRSAELTSAHETTTVRATCASGCGWWTIVCPECGADVNTER